MPRFVSRWGFGILTKQMMLVFPLSALAVMVAAGKGKVSIWKIAAASVVALLALAPPIWWNSRHEWITVAHTEHHFQSGKNGLVEMAARTGEFLASQAILITPLLFVFIIACLIKALRGWRADRGALVLALFSLPGLLVCLAMLFRQGVNPNWAAVFWSGAFALAGGIPLRSWLKWPGVSVTFGYAVVIGLMMVTAVTGKLPVVEPEKRLWNGWEEAAEKVAARAGLTASEKPLIIATGHRFAASQMAFLLPGQPEVFYCDGDPAVTSQYDFWQPTAEQMNRPVVVIAFRARPLPPGLAAELVDLKTKEGGVIEIPISKKSSLKFEIHTASGLRSWPK